jgi:glycyl-tRNA synthetase beta chain
LTPEAAALALADRLDTLVGIFGIGQSPTGSKDPFALRRASLAAIRILLRFAPQANIDVLLQKASASFDEGVLAPSVVETVKGYLLDRLPAHYDEQGVSVDILRSVTTVGTASFGDIDSRSLAVTAFAGTDAAEALASANKRVANILAKVSEPIGEVNAELLREPAEIALSGALDRSRECLAAAVADNDFPEALNQLALLRRDVDSFFDTVLVNAKDKALRLNRLALLHELRAQFLKVADLAVLAR